MSLNICRNLLSAGTCSVQNCPYVHRAEFCSVCNVLCSNGSLGDHVTGKQHQKALRGPSVPIICTICDESLFQAQWYSHCQTKGHQNLAKGQGVYGKRSMSTEYQDDVPGTSVCDVCNKVLPTPKARKKHDQSQGHRTRVTLSALKFALENAGKDKNGVKVSHSDDAGIDFGLVEVGTVDYAPRLPVVISMTTAASIHLVGTRISSNAGKYGSLVQHFSAVTPALPYKFKRGGTVTIHAKFDSFKIRGRYTDHLELDFNDTALRQRFTIIRPLQAVVGVHADYELLRPVAPYVRPRRRPRDAEGKLVLPEGERPGRFSRVKWVVDLANYEIPKDVLNILRNGSKEAQRERFQQAVLPPALTSEAYARHWHALLHAEEEQLSIDLEVYDMEDVTLEPKQNLYFLHVPGLAEKRPSVLVGDVVKVRSASEQSDLWYAGYVKVVEDIRVGLQLANSLHYFPGQRYSVRFSLSRLPLRRMHQALDTAFFPPRVLFPKPLHRLISMRPTESHILSVRPVNRTIMGNAPQLLAVTSIINLPQGSPPFIIFGPPGTGKTVTVVETIKQILHRDPNAKVLACAPSNDAADLIAQRLIDIPNSKTNLFRLNATSRPKNLLPKNLIPYSQIDEMGFAVPNVATLSTFRVIISTCVSASMVHGIGVPRGHFAYILVDEAGQAMEPEVMIPIKTMADQNTNIILSGDPKQLGPIIHSSVAEPLGLGVSYLDRLMGLDMYEPHQGHGITAVKLVKNWRSHPAILKFPNQAFYEGELQPCASPVVVDSLLQWEGLPTKGFPILFHAISGEDMREGSSPSYFNPDEVSTIHGYVRALRENQKLRLTDDHIGVISPYNAQCRKIRALLAKSSFAPKVGSTEQFQGQERRVILVSTVRSKTELVSFDIKHTLGFVANPRRFNVAMTRAQALLIIVGDPTVLSLDPVWRSFLNYVHLSGGWTGKKIDWNPHEDERGESFLKQREEMAKSQMQELMERLNLGDESEEDGEVAHDRPWREEE